MGSSVILPPPGQPTAGADPNFKSQTIPNIATWKVKDLAPPTALYMTLDDSLILTAFNSLVNQVVGIQGRMLLVDGTILRFSTSFPLTANKLGNTFGLTLGEGFLLNVAVGDSSGATQAGQTFVNLKISKGTVTTQITTSPLISGYVGGFKALSWPGASPLRSIDGPGFMHTVQQANPAAGTDWTITVPNNTRYHVKNLNAQLAIANAGVARIIRVQIRDAAANLVWQGTAQQTGAINTTVQVSAAPGQFTSVVDTTTLNLPLPSDVVLPTGFTIAASTSNINAADQWSAIWAEVEEWIDLG